MSFNYLYLSFVMLIRGLGAHLKYDNITRSDSDLTLYDHIH